MMQGRLPSSLRQGDGWLKLRLSPPSSHHPGTRPARLPLRRHTLGARDARSRACTAARRVARAAHPAAHPAGLRRRGHRRARRDDARAARYLRPVVRDRGLPAGCRVGVGVGVGVRVTLTLTLALTLTLNPNPGLPAGGQAPSTHAPTSRGGLLPRLRGTLCGRSRSAGRGTGRHVDHDHASSPHRVTNIFASGRVHLGQLRQLMVRISGPCLYPWGTPRGRAIESVGSCSARPRCCIVFERSRILRTGH